MAAAPVTGAALPAGFVFDSPAPAAQVQPAPSTTTQPAPELPAGFVLDAPTAAPQTAPQSSEATQPDPDNPNNLPDGGMGFLRHLVAANPNRTYADFWPLSKDNATGAIHGGVPNVLRTLAQGTADLLEGPQTGQLTPKAMGVVAALAGVGKGVPDAARLSTAAAPEEAAAATTAAAPSSAQTLMDSGVTLTPGQRIGGVAKTIEDSATSIPVVGDAIKGAQTRSLGDFQRAVVNQALEPIGETLPEKVTGQDAIEAGQSALGDAYDSLLPHVRLDADDAFKQSMDELSSLVQEMPPSDVTQFNSIVKNRVDQRFGDEGNMDGTTLKQVESELGQKVAQLKAGQQYQLSDAINQVRTNIRDALERQNPDQADQLAAINQAYAMFSRAQDAAIRRPTSGGNFTPSDLLQAIKNNAVRTGNKASFARGDQFLQDIAQAGQDVLPSSVPNSGTTGRAIVSGGLLGGLGAVHPASLAGILGAAGAYTKPGVAGINAVMDSTPAVLRLLAQGARGVAPAAPAVRFLQQDGQPTPNPFGGGQ